MKNNDPRALRGPGWRGWLLGCLAIGAVVGSVGALITPEPPAIPRLEPELEPGPGAVHVAPPAPSSAWSAERRAQLEVELERARRGRALNERALCMQAVDPRWGEPAQREHLAEAMRHTARRVRSQGLMIEYLEQRLAALP